MGWVRSAAESAVGSLVDGNGTEERGMVEQRWEMLSGDRLVSLNSVSPLEAALGYAREGLPVFPVAPVDPVSGNCGCREGPACQQVGKHPLVRWTDQSSTDADQVRSWWSWKPDANIGVPTGERSGVVVVDIDRHHGGLGTRAELEAAGFVFPPTLAAHTRAGGWHFFYQAPDGRRVPNTTGALAGVGDIPGIDVRGDGGYVIVAPSARPIERDPRTGAVRQGRYAWVAGPRRVALAPGWVVVPKQATKPSAVAPARPVGGERPGRDPDRRAAAALAGEVARVTGSADQGRNNALFQAAANCFEIVNTGYLSEAQVRAELTAAALAVGLGETEICHTLDAQWRRKAGVRRSGWGSEPGGTDPGGTSGQQALAVTRSAARSAQTPTRPGPGRQGFGR